MMLWRKRRLSHVTFHTDTTTRTSSYVVCILGWSTFPRKHHSLSPQLLPALWFDR